MLQFYSDFFSVLSNYQRTLASAFVGLPLQLFLSDLFITQMLVFFLKDDWLHDQGTHISQRKDAPLNNSSSLFDYIHA